MNRVDVVAPNDAAGVALADFVASIRQLPLIPVVALQLVRSVQKEDISGAELGRQIGADAALAGQLLRLVNSSYYGLSRRVATVGDALAVLGINMVRRIVISAALQRPMLEHLPDTPATRGFWRHQLLGAALARFVHGRSGADGEEAAYMAGLLHDVGRLAMFVRWPQVYGAWLARPLDGSATDDERSRFGFDHAQAGAALLHHWGIPESIVLAARHHADAAAPADPIAASVWHANRLAHRLADEPADGPEQPWMREAELGAVQRRRIVDEVDALTGGR
jgi:HD-like signal output (HDOD) protein